MKSFRERRPAIVGIVSIVLIAIGLYGAFSINEFEALRGVYQISIQLEDAAGLQTGNEVRVAGVKVGHVTGISLTPEAALVELEIGDDVRLPAETKAEVKLKTLLGQKFVDLQVPQAFLTAASVGDTAAATNGFLEDGDVLPLEQTSVPFEIHQAATQGAAKLAEIDKESLRHLVELLATTLTDSKDELRRALPSLEAASAALQDKSGEIRRLLDSASSLTETLAGSDEDIGNILARAAEVLEVLAERRATTSSLLAATDDLSNNLALLIEAARGSIQSGSASLDSLLTAVEGDLDSLDAALAELGTAQELFGQTIKFGRFIEGHVCAVTTEDLCVPGGSPSNPGVPVKGTQPTPAPRVLP